MALRRGAVLCAIVGIVSLATVLSSRHTPYDGDSVNVKQQLEHLPSVSDLFSHKLLWMPANSDVADDAFLVSGPTRISKEGDISFVLFGFKHTSETPSIKCSFSIQGKKSEAASVNAVFHTNPWHLLFSNPNTMPFYGKDKEEYFANLLLSRNVSVPSTEGRYVIATAVCRVPDLALFNEPAATVKLTGTWSFDPLALNASPSPRKGGVTLSQCSSLAYWDKAIFGGGRNDDGFWAWFQRVIESIEFNRAHGVEHTTMYFSRLPSEEDYRARRLLHHYVRTGAVTLVDARGGPYEIYYGGQIAHFADCLERQRYLIGAKYTHFFDFDEFLVFPDHDYNQSGLPAYSRLTDYLDMISAEDNPQLSVEHALEDFEQAKAAGSECDGKIIQEFVVRNYRFLANVCGQNKTLPTPQGPLFSPYIQTRPRMPMVGPSKVIVRPRYTQFVGIHDSYLDKNACGNDCCTYVVPIREMIQYHLRGFLNTHSSTKCFDYLSPSGQQDYLASCYKQMKYAKYTPTDNATYCEVVTDSLFSGKYVSDMSSLARSVWNDAGIDSM